MMYRLVFVVLIVNVVTGKCLPVHPAGVPAMPPPVPTPPSPSSGSAVIPAALTDDILRHFNMTHEQLDVVSVQAKNLRQSAATAAATAAAVRPTDAAAATLSPIQILNRKKSGGLIESSRAATERKKEIQRRVMGFVSQNGRPFPSAMAPTVPSTVNLTSPQRGEHVADLPSGGGFTGVNVGRLRYIQPSCDVPKHTDEEIWLASGSFNLYFNVSGIQPRDGYQLYVIGAKIRLFKYSEGTAEGSSSCTDATHDSPSSTGSSPFFDPITDEEKVRISIHNFTRALKKHRVPKKKLLDSLMALTKEEGYMELDVKLAARWWLVPGGRNLGLVIEVEDTDGQRKPATSYFRQRNCSGYVEGASNELSDPSSVASPVLELTVVEIPDLKAASASSSGDSKKRLMEEDAAEDEAAIEEKPRRHRHHSHHHPHDEQADDASRFQPIPFNSGSRPSNAHPTKPNKNGGRLTSTTYSAFRPSAIQPSPTLATLEDHDFMEPDATEAGNKRREEMMRLLPQRIFMEQMRHSPNIFGSSHPRKRSNF